MEYCLLFDQARPVRSRPPGSARTSQRLDFTKRFLVGHVGQLTGAHLLKGFHRLAILSEPLFSVRGKLHDPIIRARIQTRSPSRGAEPKPRIPVIYTPTYRVGSSTPASANPFFRSKQLSQRPQDFPSESGS